MSVFVYRPDRRPRYTLPRLVALTAGMVFAAGTLVAAPPLPESLHIPGAPASIGLPAPRADAARIAAVAEPALLGALGAGRRQDFFITLGERADLKAAYAMNWRDRGRYVYKTLRDTADRSQAKLRAALAAQGARFQPYWIMNAILVRDGDLATLARVAAFTDVERIALPPHIVPVEREQRAAAAAATAGVTDNVRRIGADRAWERGTTGDGVTVGIVDTGSEFQHEALRPQYRGTRDGGTSHDYNWFDPEHKTAAPRATEEHGNHVAGIVAGDNRNPDPARRERIGVAPGARWISCLALGTASGDPYIMPDCLQFMLAPSRTDGTLPDPDRRPEIVNNSWHTGGSCTGSGESLYQEAIEAWAAAGIVPVFAAGNARGCDLAEPPGLSTVSAPASLAASFAVGSTGNRDGRYAPHSLWGPTAAVSTGLPMLPDPRGYPQLKPQVVAPGVAIRSAVGGTTDYITMTGTSMSAPHVAGTFALMIEAGACLRGDYATLGTLLMQTARPVPYDSGGTPAPGPGNVPNYATGWGEIDAAAAVEAAANACGPYGFLRGRVTAPDGRPVAGARIDVVDANARTYSLTSDTDGSYVRRLPPSAAGGYVVRVAAYGFLPGSEGGVPVADGATTVRDVTLATAALHKVTGRVTDAQTGWPLHARIAIAGYPGDAVWTDPVTGVYAVRLPEGAAYRFDLTTEIPGYLPAWRDVADVASTQQDFALRADTVACTSPGYAYARRVLGENFENNGAAPPSGWTATSEYGIGWRFGTSDDIAGRAFFLPEHGRFAANNDELGPGDGWENDASVEYLTSPAFDLAGVTRPVLRFSYVLQQQERTAVAVQGSVDGGATWIALDRVDPLDGGTEVRWLDAVVDLVPLAGAANARVRFFYSDGTDATRPNVLGAVFAVDDLAVDADCAAPARGGLVVGRVRDGNDGVALDGARVSANGGPATTSYTSADPAVGKGFYATHSASTAVDLAAQRGSLPAGYGDATAAGTVADGGTTSVDVRLPAGRLRLYPASGPSADVVLGSTATVPLTVHNSGTVPLEVAFERVAVEQHFEGAFPPAGWAVRLDTTRPCGWVRSDRISNVAGGDGLAAGVQGYDCNDSLERIDTSLLLPPVDLSHSASASLGFFLGFQIGADDAPRLDADVSTDAGATWSTVWSWTRQTVVHAPPLIEIDLTPYAGRPDVRVRLRYVSTPPNSYVVVDQVHLFDGAGSDERLDLAPARASLAPGESRDLQATLDARRIAQPGVYSVPLRVAENTPYAWPFDGTVTATLNVTAPASYGWFGGAVRGLGACDIAPTTLPGANVRIRAANGDTFETTTDADGRYRYWLPPAGGPYMLTARAADHRDADARTLALNPGAETPADLELRALLPCLLADPGRLVASTAPGRPAALPFRLLNGGTTNTVWTVRAGGDPAQGIPLPVSQTMSPDPEIDMWTGCVGRGYTHDNHFMRRFPLRDVANPAEILTVSGIEFAIDAAFSNAGQQTVYARVYALRGDGSLRFANLQLLREKAVTIADTRVDRVRVDFDRHLTIGRDAVLVASVYSPSGFDHGNTFGIGFNLGGESAEAYLASAVCELHEPTPVPVLLPPGAPTVNMLLELDVLGSAPCHERATPVSWLAFSPTAGSVAAGAAAAMEARFAPGALATGTHHATMCVRTANTGAETAVPVTLHVGAGDTLFKDGFE